MPCGPLLQVPSQQAEPHPAQLQTTHLPQPEVRVPQARRPRARDRDDAHVFCHAPQHRAACAGPARRRRSLRRGDGDGHHGPRQGRCAPLPAGHRPPRRRTPTCLVRHRPRVATAACACVCARRVCGCQPRVISSCLLPSQRGAPASRLPRGLHSTPGPPRTFRLLASWQHYGLRQPVSVCRASAAGAPPVIAMSLARDAPLAKPHAINTGRATLWPGYTVAVAHVSPGRLRCAGHLKESVTVARFWSSDGHAWRRRRRSAAPRPRWSPQSASSALWHCHTPLCRTRAAERTADTRYRVRCQRFRVRYPVNASAPSPSAASLTPRTGASHAAVLLPVLQECGTCV